MVKLEPAVDQSLRKDVGRKIELFDPFAIDAGLYSYPMQHFEWQNREIE